MNESKYQVNNKEVSISSPQLQHKINRVAPDKTLKEKSYCEQQCESSSSAKEKSTNILASTSKRQKVILDSHHENRNTRKE